MNIILTLKFGLKITQGTISKLRYGLLFAFYSNYGRILAILEIFSVKEWYELENRVRVRSGSLEMAPFDRSHTSSYSPYVVTMAVSLAMEIFSVKEWPDLEMWVWGSSRSLKMAGFDRPCMTFYYSAIVTSSILYRRE